MSTGRPAMVRLIGRFLRDRLGLITAFYIQTGLIIALATLVLSYHGLSAEVLIPDAWYAALLSTVVLLLYLGYDLARWWPFTTQAERLVQDGAGLDKLVGLPPAFTAEQEACRDLLAQARSLALAERAQREEEHQRHLAFIHLWVHQMKTPVSAISLIAQRARDQEPSELESALASIEEETARLAEGLDLVLHVARLQQFASDYRIERVDLLTSLRAVINSRKKQFIRLCIFPEIEGADGAASNLVVLTDAKWNRFILDQVISNALKYGSQGGPPGQRLRFLLERGDQEIRLTVADQGPGIPPEDLPRVFEPFFTGENGRRFGDATGIGLYVVKQVADRLGHAISIASEPGQGTAVTITYRT